MAEVDCRRDSAPDLARSSARMSPLDIQFVGFDQLDVIRRLNRTIFDEERIINTFEREDLLMYLAFVDDEPVAFKVGYRENRFNFYSAKGGVLAAFRRQGIARALLYEMQDEARRRDFRHFCFDTFPNRDPGMTILALHEGFRLTRADFNTTYRDYRLRFEKPL